MNIKDFNKITKDVFLDFGFIKLDKYYVMELDELFIFARVDSFRGAKSIRYFISIKQLHNDSQSFNEKSDLMFEQILFYDNDSVKNPMYQLLYQEWSESYYKNLLRDLLHNSFSGYKEKRLQHLRDIGHTLQLKQEALKYIYSYKDITMKMKERMIDYYSDDSSYVVITGIVLKRQDNCLRVRITSKNAGYYYKTGPEQDFIFYDNEVDLSSFKIGQEKTFITTDFVFYNTPYPIIALLSDREMSMKGYFSLLSQFKKKYIKWLNENFPTK